ncbi:predicted protein [Clavispora lusitaniae ATCC 42720]|uniref:Uncharacterized protein n=1 Tax=Clavispora lusitaniae (strain ATCC 42720) TaxID=306902 RepID=C4Y0S2_CLAL4|nr:uncharacterized protein CLUG_01804 [Clavispora lusitaniae ATCC 42720]EEQ37681.1 predicted protein [Clavispora lusitaniae ATCC 42720]KAF5211980.1 hypothetical protein E0198_001529 [Clavispora lusitaniae]
MTRLCVDPSALALQFPRAAPTTPVRVRVLAQVQHYDEAYARLFVVRCANLPRTEQIDLDGDGENKNQNTTVAVDVSEVLANLGPRHVRVGAVVSIWGMYDGESIHAVECEGVESADLTGQASVLAEIAALGDL